MSISELYKIFRKYPKISTDSRKIEANSLFFALKGENFNGNKFAKNAIESGAKYAIIDETKFAIKDRTILVDDVLATLQKLATHHREQLQTPILAITGTNGKTTTKELVYSVLSQKFRTLATEGNLNNHIGVPLTLLKITEQTQIAVVEMGANHIGEIDFLCNIAEPNFGIITNVGIAHIEGFGSFEGVIEAKTELYSYLQKTAGKIFVNSDNKILVEHSQNIPKFTYGKSESSQIKAKLLPATPFLNLSFAENNNFFELETNLIGNYNFENVLASIAIGKYFKIETKKIINAIKKYQPKNNRSQLKKTQNNTLILDLYNANPSSMAQAINNLHSFDAPHKTLILGDMLELGKTAQEEHQKIVNLLNKLNFENVFLVGNEFLKTINKFTNFENVEKLNDFLSKNKIESQTILIKGSRGIKLEKCVNFL